MFSWVNFGSTKIFHDFRSWLKFGQNVGAQNSEIVKIRGRCFCTSPKRQFAPNRVLRTRIVLYMIKKDVQVAVTRFNENFWNFQLGEFRVDQNFPRFPVMTQIGWKCGRPKLGHFENSGSMFLHIPQTPVRPKSCSAHSNCALYAKNWCKSCRDAIQREFLKFSVG